MKKEKGVSKLTWIVVAVVAIAIGGYFLLTGNGGVPTPPALPA